MSQEQLSQQDIQKRTKQSLLWGTAIPFSMHLLRFVNSLLLARILSPDDFGIVGIVTVLLYYSDSFCDFGFARAIVQRKEVLSQHYNSYFSFNIVVSLLFFSVFQFFSGEIAEFFETPELESAFQLFTFILIITAFLAVPRVKLRRELNFKTLAIIDAFKVTVSMTVSLTMALNGYGFWALIVSMLVAQLAILLPTLYCARIFPRPTLELKYLRQLVRFGKWDFLGSQIKLVADNVDKLIIGKVLGTTQLGFYDKALGLAKMPYEQISTRVGNISFSSFSRVQDDEKEVRYYLSRVIVFNVIILAPLLTGLAFVAESFVMFVLGPKWQNMIDSLVIFSFAFLFASITSPITSVNLAMNKVKAQTIISLVLTLALVSSMLFFVQHGIEVVAMILLVFQALMFFSSFTLLKTHLPLTWGNLFTNLVPAIVYSMIMGGFIFLYQMLMSGAEHWLVLVGSIMIGVFTYVVAILVLPFETTRFVRRKIARIILPGNRGERN